MTAYRCRSLVPTASEWVEVEGAWDGDAANLYHMKVNLEVPSLRYCHQVDGKTTYIEFMLVEVEGHGEHVSRVFSHGIFRKGGVKLGLSLREIASRLGYENDPETLVEEGWEGEVSFEQARTEKGWP